VKNGAGILMLATANTYSGGTTISGGTLVINADNGLGAASSPLKFSVCRVIYRS